MPNLPNLIHGLIFSVEQKSHNGLPLDDVSFFEFFLSNTGLLQWVTLNTSKAKSP